MGFLTGFEAFVRQREPLGPHTWFGLGGAAEYYAEPQSLDQLAELVGRARSENVAIRLIGGGSNVLVRDEGVPGVVVQLAAECFRAIEVAGRVVKAGGGAKLGHVISTAVREGLAGLDTLVGIPGTIGGALHGNAGTRGGDVGQWTCRATVMTRTGEICQRERDDMTFNYRESSLDELVIVSAEFELDHDDPLELTKRMQKQWIVKKASQPMGHQSAGCIFKNPRGMSAGLLIEQAGLKGTRVGGAEVSDRHANFITVQPPATSQDVLRLIELVRGRVSERVGVDLETEIDIW